MYLQALSEFTIIGLLLKKKKKEKAVLGCIGIAVHPQEVNEAKLQHQTYNML